MKIKKMANKALKSMVTSYSESDKDFFDFDYFRNIFPDISDDTITKCLYLLSDDNLVTIQPADGIAYMTFLSAKGIQTCQEDTLFKKGYDCIKEIKSLIS